MKNFYQFPELGGGEILFRTIRHIKRTDKVLEIGCSWGYWTRFYAKSCKNIFSVDVIPQYISVAKKRYDLNFSIASGESLPFHDNSFDAVVMNEVLEHIPDDKKVFSEVFRVLKPNGKFIISVPHKGLFWFIDTDNFILYSKKFFPHLYKFFYKLRLGKMPETMKLRKGYETPHKHYSLYNFSRLAGDKFRIEEYSRDGFLVSTFHQPISLIYTSLFGDHSFEKVKRILRRLEEKENKINFNEFSFDIFIVLAKN